MDKDGFFPAVLSWQPELSSSPPADHLPPSCFVNLNWDQPVDHSGAHFESALSSLVSSPSSAANPAAADSFVIRELIGRLGSICNSGELSPPSSRYQSATASCYTTPLNSPPKLNLSIMDHHQQLHPTGGGLPPAQMVPFSADPGFVERAARFSCFGGGGRSSAQIGYPEAGKLSRVSSSQSLKAGVSQMLDGIHLDSRLFGSSTLDEGRELGNNAFMEESSASDRIANGGQTAAGESNARKRKAASKGKAKVPPKVEEEEDSNTKRFRSSISNGDGKDSAIKPKIEQNGGTSTNDNANKKHGKESNAKLPEPPKDYIHVRARRGQATDSHSLAERVRRERISERMKLLQDLVPGCNKVTGKAVMLDEIINYVQSLQRQVEFLSMKLSTVDVLVDLNMENSIQKEMNQLRGPVLPHAVYPLEATSTAFSYAQQPQDTPLQNVATNGVGPQYPVNHSDSGFRRMLGMQVSSLDGFGDTATQIGAFWEDDLQSVVQMGFVQNQEAAFSSQSFHDGLNRGQT